MKKLYKISVYTDICYVHVFDIISESEKCISYKHTGPMKKRLNIKDLDVLIRSETTHMIELNAVSVYTEQKDNIEENIKLCKDAFKKGLETRIENLKKFVDGVDDLIPIIDGRLIEEETE